MPDHLRCTPTVLKKILTCTVSVYGIDHKWLCISLSTVLKKTYIVCYIEMNIWQAIIENNNHGFGKSISSFYAHQIKRIQYMCAR